MSDLGAIFESGGAAAVELAASALSERGHNPGKCPNCGAPMIGAYCAVCGQERDTHRRSVWGLISALIEDIASFDSRILRTATALIFRPGELASAFREGRPRRYVPALRLYLFVSLIFFLILGVSNIAIMQLQVVATPQKVTWINGKPYVANTTYDKDDIDARFMPKMIPISRQKATQPGGPFEFSTKVYFFSRIGAYHSTLSKAARDRLAKANVEIELNEEAKPGAKKPAPSETKSWIETHIFDGLQRVAADPAALNAPLTSWIPRVLFLLLPLYALVLSVFYWRKRKTFYFVDHLIFSLSVHTFAFVALMADAGLAQILPGETVGWLTVCVLGVYLFLAMKNFYMQGWIWTTVKFVFVTGVYTIFCLFPALGAVIILSFLNV